MIWEAADTLSSVYVTINSLDCGVCAAAFAVEWALLGCEASLEIAFKRNVMRDHLLQCLEMDQAKLFPRYSLEKRPEKDYRMVVYIYM